MTRAEQRNEVLAILERDYQGARELMGASNGSIDRTRTFGFALVAALIGFSANSHILWPGLLAALACLLLAYLDGYHCWRYRQAVDHARRIERINQLVYKSHTSTLSEREAKSLELRAAAFLPGVLTGQGAYTFRDVRFCVPGPMLLLYTLLVIAGVGIGGYESTAGASTQTVNARILRSPGEHQAQLNPAVLARDAMTVGERQQLGRLIVQLRDSHDPAAVQFATAASALLSGIPSAAATIVTSLADRGTSLEQQAAGIIGKALADAATAVAGPASETTVNNNHQDQSHFSLNAPSLVLNLASPTSSKQQQQQQQQHTEETHTSTVLPYTP